MKICPKCRTKFGDELNFCLDDGIALETVTVDKANFDGQEMASYEKLGRISSQNRQRPTNPQNFPNYAAQPSAKKSNVGKIIAGIGIVALLFVGGMIYGLITVISNMDFPETRPTPSYPTPMMTPYIKTETEKPTAKLEVEVLEKVKDNFGLDYLKCMVTNVGDSVIVDPSITLDLYEDDVKVGNLYERSSIKFLKPQQKVPVWISLFAGKKFTSAKYDKTKSQRVSDKTVEKLFPSLVFTDAKMEIETGNSSFNNRIYKDKLYVVSGIVENPTYENISPELFIIYYDANEEIVGITSTHPSAMKRGEKSKFSASIGKINTFGNPTKFEIIAVNDRN
jgi:hypothetical protein